MNFKRYAIYFMPDGSLGHFGASWLGWDPLAGTRTPFLNLQGFDLDLVTLTKAPRKYGLHATLKPPFRLNLSQNESALIAGFEEFCAKQAPARSGRLTPKIVGGFLALVPQSDPEQLNRLARDCVTFFDPFRAPLNEAELAKRRKRPLNQYQEDMLLKWGYPYVFDAFRFHITLTAQINNQLADRLIPFLSSWLDPILEDPFFIKDLVLAGEDDNGQFHELLRRELRG